MEVLTRKCSRCQSVKPLNEFRKAKDKPLGRHYHCLVCHNLFNNCQRFSKLISKAIGQPFVFTPAMRQAMLAEQNGCCLICKKPESETTNNLSIDHCHLTHRIRGLLCASCNVGISCFNDDAILIRKTIDYLLLPRDNKPLLNGWQGKVGFHAERFNGLIDWGGRQILAKQQNYCCAICDINESELRRNLEVDHCHNTGVIRGLLCERCNKGLGLFRDKTDVLRTAIQYLSQPKPLTSELADCLI